MILGIEAESRTSRTSFPNQSRRSSLDTLLRITAVLGIDLKEIIAKARKAVAKREQ